MARSSGRCWGWVTRGNLTSDIGGEKKPGARPARGTGRSGTGTVSVMRRSCMQHLCTSCLVCPHFAGKSWPLACVTCSKQRLGDAQLPRFRSSARTGLGSGILHQRQRCICEEGGDLAGTGGFPQPWEAFSGFVCNKLCKFSLGLLQELEMSQIMAEMPLCCMALPGFPCCPLCPTLPG